MNGIHDSELHSYIDGQSSPETAARVERHVAEHPEAARRLRETREDIALLRRYFTALEAQIPDRYLSDTLRRVIDHRPQRKLSRLAPGLRVAAMLVVLIAASVMVNGVKLSMTVPAFADAAALAYQDIVREPIPHADDPTMDPRFLIEWLNQKTGLVIRVPYAEEHGFSLTDGRLTSFDRRTAGLMVYEDWRRHRVVIFVTRVSDSDDPQPHFAFDRATYINYWSRNGVGVVIAAADEQDLKEFTRATQEQIDVSVLPYAGGSR